MNRDTAAKILPVITAFAQGKTIQYFSEARNAWKDLDDPFWTSKDQYRIKPVMGLEVTYKFIRDDQRRFVDNKIVRTYLSKAQANLDPIANDICWKNVGEREVELPA